MLCTILICLLTFYLGQTRLEMQKALEEDKSVYEYDNVYDDIQKQRLESNKKLLGGTDRKVFCSYSAVCIQCLI